MSLKWIIYSTHSDDLDRCYIYNPKLSVWKTNTVKRAKFDDSGDR